MSLGARGSQASDVRALTERQVRVLQEVAKAISTGVPPTLQELAEALGVRSKFGVHQHLIALERKGAITRTKSPRNIRLTTVGKRLAAEAGR